MTDHRGVTRIVLVGFMGSGKTTVGRRLAERLGWAFHDADAEIEKASGRTIPQLFRGEGEAAFRGLEEEFMRSLLALDRVVVASGGGWGARPGRLRALGDETLSVWLRVSAGEAVRRCADSPGARPLLAVEDPVAEAATLLRRRAGAYAEADVEVDTETLRPEDVAERILGLVGIERRTTPMKGKR